MMFNLVRPGSTLNPLGANLMVFRKQSNLPLNPPIALSTPWHKNSELQLKAYKVGVRKKLDMSTAS
jgi:hypothetical protein